jgi:hypothetical protein
MTLNNIFGMQRANGDWFALLRRNGTCVPLFSSDRDAKQARAFNVEMLVFKSVRLDDRALNDLRRSVSDSRTYFWLVDKGSTSMSRGQALTHEEVVALVRNGGDETTVSV